ncbi:MAG: PAS domain-containing sensor histidine kinase [Pseudomonadota bacterium]
MSRLDEYRRALDLSPLASLLVGPDGRIGLVNDELAELFGYSAEELVGQPVETLLPPASRSVHTTLRRSYQDAPEKRRMGQGRDLQGVTRTGQLIPLELGLHPVDLAEEGQWTMVTVVDTTERLRNEALARATLEASASAMVMVSGEGTIVSVNRAAQALFDYADDEMLGQPVEMLVPKYIRDKHPTFRKTFSERSSVRPMGASRQIFARRKSGEQFRVEVALTPVEVGDRQLVLATIVDLTERLAVESEIAARRAAEAQSGKLARLNNELARFAYAASHDLKAPLLSIVGVLRLCLEDIADGDLATATRNLRRTLELAVSSAEKVENVLHLARVGHERSRSEEVDLKGIVEEVWTALTLGAPDPPRLEMTIDLDAPFTSVPSAIRVVLENLMSNACRFQDPDKADRWVRVTARQERATLHLEIADNGVGIPKKHLPDLFGMFSRFSRQSGHGLGLAMVRSQVEHLGGRIQCDADEKVGAAFQLTLPMNRK